MDFYYHGAWRMDWGLGNPNKTATLIACLMLAVWLAACFWRRGFWFALPVATVLGYCLVQTFSRGGMLALFAGAVVLLAWTPRPWSRARLMAAVAAIWIVGFFILQAKAETRYGRGLFSEDQSIDSRLVVWRHFPEMLAAAPWGWGGGRAGDVYTQWFQPVDQSVNFLNLLNSHFTWMAEGGWGFSTFYLASWIAAILLCWPAEESPMRGVPLAVWAAFGVGGIFSQVEDSFWLWVVPLLLLGLVVYRRFQQKAWPSVGSLGLAALFSTCVITALILIGCVTVALPVKADSKSTVIGRGSNRTVIFVDRAVMGKLYGHTLRKFLAGDSADLSANTYIITEAPEYIVPDGVSQIVVSGKMAQNLQWTADLRQVNRVILINPSCLPEEMKWIAPVASRMCVYFGEYSQESSRSSWEACPGVRYLMINGAGDFVPAWPGAIWKPAGA